MSKPATLLFIAVLVLSSFAMVGSVFAQSVPTPSVPEFTVKFVNASYTVTTANSFTGLDETEFVSNDSIEITITNQAFDHSSGQIYYNVRVKPHFVDDWTEVYPVSNRTSSYRDGVYSYAQYINKKAIIQSDSSYTNITFPVIPTTIHSESGYDVTWTYPGDNGIAYFSFLSAIPDDSQLDFQVQALVGHDSQVWVSEFRLLGPQGGHYDTAIAYDTASSWSSTQTITIGEKQTPSPSPTEQELILGAVAIVAVSAFGLILLYRIKRK
jgi:hypothetical protein